MDHEIYGLFLKVMSNLDEGNVYCVVIEIEDSSWVRVRDQDIFALHLTGRPSDEGTRCARNVQCKDVLISNEEAQRILYLSIRY